MAQNDPQSNVSLPEKLRWQFSVLNQRLWKVETGVAICFALTGLFLSYLLLFISDRLWDSPVWFRFLAFVFGVLGAVVIAFFWMKQWVFQKRDLNALAILVQRKFRRLGDRLLGIVELAGEKRHADNFSPELYRAAIQQVAEEAEKFDFTEAVDSRPLKRLLSIAAVLLMLVLLPAILVPAASWNAFLRWIAPASALQRYTLVRLKTSHPKLVVPHGEAFTVSAKIDFRSIWKPSYALAQFERQSGIEAKVQAGQILFHIPGQVQKGVLKITIGDASSEIEVEPSYRPALKQMTAFIVLPDYLKYPMREEKLQSGSLSLLEGSRVWFRGKITHNLEKAFLTTGNSNKSLSISGDEFQSEPVESDDVFQFIFSWQNKLGLSNAAPWKLKIQSQKDLPPAPNLPELSRDTAILQTDVIEIDAVAKDDFGVRDIGLSWEADPIGEGNSSMGTTEMRRERKASNEKGAGETFRWSPAIFQIPADTSIQMVAFATDYFPQRRRSESSVHRIHILGNEKHAEVIRQNLESVLARVEEIARAEEKVLAGTSDLREAAKAEAEKSKTRSASENANVPEAAKKMMQAEKLVAEQEQNAKNLDELANEGMKTLREALKNPVFTEQSLQDWSKIMKQMQQLSQQPMKAAAEKLKSAQQNSGDAKAKQQDLADAQTKEEESLEQLEKLQNKVNKKLDDLQALTLAERLRKLAATQNEISIELKKTIPDTIGMLPDELPVKFKRIDSQLAAVQEETQIEAGKLRDEINRFHERTQKHNYGDISKEMDSFNTVDELDRVRGLIQGNVAMEATRNLATWEKRFNEWAEKLEPPKEDAQDDSSGKGQPGGENITKTLLTLLRLREKEMTLQSQTVLLEEQKTQFKNYADRIEVLSVMQRQVIEKITEIDKANKVAQFKKPYLETIEAMMGVESLLKIQQTDMMTTQSEAKAIELLTDVINLINEQAKRNPSPGKGEGESEQSPSAEDMAFLTQMMSEGKGSKPGVIMSQGLNQNGGSTDRRTKPLTGDANGTAGENRKTNKASGTSGNSLPVEFRETLENYFKAIEQNPN